MSSHFVDVWHGELLSEQGVEKNYWCFLDDMERERAKSFTREILQTKYIQTRGILRKILSSYLNIEPQKLIIKTGVYGKPFLAEGTLTFNLSHKENKFVVVVSNLEMVGIDLELCRKRDHMAAMVKKCFSETESAYWHALPVEQKTLMFYRFWVRKEAFVKAVGRGIALGLNQCSVNPSDQTQFVNIPTLYGLATEWNIVDIILEKNDVCALVLKDESYQYKQLKWS